MLWQSRPERDLVREVYKRFLSRNCILDRTPLLHSIAMIFGLQTFVLIAIIPSALSHSCAECVSYDPTSFDYQTFGNYDRSRCSGYPRGFKRQFQEGFGIDTGYNWGHDDCSRDQYNANDYADQITMAKYHPGQQIYISHPSKNHVAAECTNKFIPSVDMKVKMSSRSGVDTFDVDLALVGGDHVSGQIDHLGYQRCFNFCSNMDKSHCLTSWIIPQTATEGIHSFRWVGQSTHPSSTVPALTRISAPVTLQTRLRAIQPPIQPIVTLQSSPPHSQAPQ